jgi:serine/threonine protein kinase
VTPERWQRLLDVFHGALERSGSEREDYIRRECGSDEAMASEVRNMLDEHSRTGLLDRPVLTTPVRGAFHEGQELAGRYRIVRFLNRGGMGEVYEAHDREFKDRVALKTLLPEIAADAAMIARFKQEIQLSRKIAHPNVCKVYDLGRHEATVFLTMEFLAGETLAARLAREGRLPCDAALPLLSQMAEALEAAHRAGVIHRDLKPSNVMLESSPEGTRAVVTDFGLARSFTPDRETTATKTAGVAGTLDYMAPELLTGQSASASSDLYALGMVAYKMVAGVLPFPDDTPLAGAIQRSKAPVPSPRTVVPDLDPRWERAILRALDQARTKRFARPSDFIEALRSDSATLTVPLPAMTRRRWLGAAVTLLLLIGVGIGVGYWLRSRSAPSAEAMALYRTGVDDIHAGAYFAATKALGEAVKAAPRFGLAHARLAEAWMELQVPERADQEMLLALREDISAFSRLDRLQTEAIHLATTRDFAGAAGKYELIHAAKPQDSDADVDLGRAYESAGQVEKALASYRLATAGPSRSPSAWLRLAVLFDRRSDRQNSEAAFQEAERLYGLTSNLEGLTEVAFRRGVAADRHDRFDEAASLLGKALETSRVSQDVQQEIRIRVQFATHYYQTGDTARAEEYAKQAVDTARSNQMELFAISGIVQLGNAYRAKMDLQGAERLYNEALALARRANSERQAAVSLLNLASLHDRLDRSEESAREAREALAIYQANGFLAESSQAQVLIGRAQRKLGDLPGAQGSFQHALQLAEKGTDRGTLALARESLASLLMVQENYPAALPYYQKNLELRSDARGRVTANTQLGRLSWMLGRYADARKSFDAAEADVGPFPSLRLSLMLARAEMALSEERFRDAATLARQALPLAAQDPPTTAELQGALGQALIALGNKREGLAKCEESLRQFEKLSDLPSIMRARLIVLQARMDAGGARAAAGLLEDGAKELASRPETHWRSLALLARMDHQKIPDARRGLDDLRQAWGDAAMAQYLSRPDISRLARPLL